MKKLFRFIGQSFCWVLVVLFCLFVYVGVKGFTSLMAMKYQMTTSFIPLLLELGLEGIVSIILLLVMAYGLAPMGKMAAAVFVLLLCSGFNGFNVWRVITGQISLPLWEVVAILGLGVLFGIITCMGLYRFKRYRAQVAAENM